MKNSKEKGISTRNNSSMTYCAQTAGITLVALVVTIVVLLILAGITLNAILGQNSIFNSANEAKNKTGISAFEEKLGMVYTDVMLERGGSGGLTPDKYFEILKNHGIISDTTVPGGNISSPTENEDGSKTYEITSDDDYIFEATIYPDGRVETEVIGKDGSIEAKVRSIAVTTKTQTSISIKVYARLQGGEVKAYYKILDDVAEDEAEESITGYTEITLNNNLEGTASGLMAGEEYKIKVILIKDGETVNVKSIDEAATPQILVSSITLNKTSLTLGVESKATLTVAIEPTNADNKNVTWSSEDSTIATVSQTGEVTGVKAGETTITVTTQDNGKKSVTCQVTVIEKGAIPYSWEELGKIANAISNTSLDTYNENTTEISVEVEGDTKTLKVGDWTRIDGKRVRILGFNHDTLTSSTAYGEATTSGRAGISFEYLDCLIYSAQMHPSNNNTNGWVTKDLYKVLNTDEKGTAKYKELKTTKGIPIKQVQKIYNATYSKSDPKTSSDYLWLLSCSEIWGNSAETGCFSGYSMAEEGKQYSFYSNCTPKPVWNIDNDNVKHYNNSENAYRNSWLRSPSYANSLTFTSANQYGRCDSNGADSWFMVAPGFSI